MSPTCCGPTRPHPNVCQMHVRLCHRGLISHKCVSFEVSATRCGSPRTHRIHIRRICIHIRLCHRGFISQKHISFEISPTCCGLPHTHPLCVVLRVQMCLYYRSLYNRNASQLMFCLRAMVPHTYILSRVRVVLMHLCCRSLFTAIQLFPQKYFFFPRIWVSYEKDL